VRIVQGPRHARRPFVPRRLHIRGAAREEDAVDQREDFRDVEWRLEHGNQQRQAACRLSDSRNVFLADRVKRVRADHASIGWNANDGFSA
jgi:hypothetical protein